MRRLFVFFFLVIILASSVSSIASNLDKSSSKPIQNPSPKKVSQTLYLKEKLDMAKTLKLLKVFEDFDLLTFKIDIKKGSILAEYDPKRMSIGEILVTLKKIGYHVQRIE